MQPGGHPVRPLPVAGQGADLQQLLELARAGGMGGRSAFSSVPGGGAFPEFSLYNAAQLSGLLGPGAGAGMQLDQLAQLRQLQALQLPGAGGMLAPASAPPESSTSHNSQGRAGSRGDKSSSAYASRHQAAEQRRRNRINDRLERLRQVVPHSERANTATFLEEAIKYVEALQARVTQLETAQGLPPSCAPVQQKQVPVPPGWNQPAATPAVDAPGAAAAQPPVTTAAAAPASSQQPQLPAAALQRDRPETPPQGRSEAEEPERAPSAEPSEGSAPKRQRTADPGPAAGAS